MPKAEHLDNQTVLFEKFKLLSCLKKDSFSSVYLADHIYLNKQIILKVLHTAGISDPSVLERFKREAKIMARLDHPNIIRVLDFGQQGSDFYLSFEFFKSQNLREVLRNNTLDAGQRKNILIQLLQGMSAAHYLGIIHRDIKPENLLINDQNQLKIADFGLALVVDESALTKKSSIVGTPAYMSPEQIRGETVSAQSDLFSLGIVACEIFCGTNPFIGKDINATINSILTFDPKQISAKLENLPEDLRQAIEHCLQRDKNLRFQSADEILDSLKVNKIEPEKAPDYDRYKRPVFYVAVFMSVILLVFIMVKINQTPELPFPADSTSFRPDSMINSDILKVQKKTQPEIDLRQSVPKNEVEKKENDSALEKGNFILIGTPFTTIMIDSQQIGQLPLTGFISLPAGIHELQLIHKDYPVYTRELEIKAGSNHIMQLSLDTLFGYLNCQIYPWAELYIDGKHKGQSPFLNPLVLTPGEHLLTVINPSWPEFRDTVVMVRKETTEFRINLEQMVFQMKRDSTTIR